MPGQMKRISPERFVCEVMRIDRSLRFIAEEQRNDSGVPIGCIYISAGALRLGTFGGRHGLKIGMYADTIFGTIFDRTPYSPLVRGYLVLLDPPHK